MVSGWVNVAAALTCVVPAMVSDVPDWTCMEEPEMVNGEETCVEAPLTSRVDETVTGLVNVRAGRETVPLTVRPLDSTGAADDAATVKDDDPPVTATAPAKVAAPLTWAAPLSVVVVPEATVRVPPFSNTAAENVTGLAKVIDGRLTVPMTERPLCSWG